MYCYYLNAEFAAKTLVFGGPRGCSELVNMSIRWFVKLETNLLHFHLPLRRQTKRVVTETSLSKSNQICTSSDKKWLPTSKYFHEDTERIQMVPLSVNAFFCFLCRLPLSSTTNGLGMCMLEKIASTLFRT